MNKLYLLIGIVFGLIVISCTSDNDNANQNELAGELIINGETSDLTKGFIIPNYNGSDPNFDPRRFYFVLTNGNVSLKNNEFVYSEEITQLVDFNMYSSEQSSGSVDIGTYLIRDLSDSNFNTDIAYIDHSGVNTNVVIENGNYVSSDLFSTDNLNGEATISISNGVYTVTFSYSDNQNQITGKFTGKLTDLNYEY